MCYGNFLKFGTRSISVIMSRISVMSDQWKVSLNTVMLQNVMHHSTEGNFIFIIRSPYRPYLLEENKILFELLSKLLASLTRNNFSKQPLGAPLHTLTKLYDVLVGFATPPPHSFEVVYCFICGRKRVTVARYRMICLVHIPNL